MILDQVKTEVFLQLGNPYLTRHKILNLWVEMAMGEDVSHHHGLKEPILTAGFQSKRLPKLTTCQSLFLSFMLHNEIGRFASSP